MKGVILVSLPLAGKNKNIINKSINRYSLKNIIKIWVSFAQLIFGFLKLVPTTTLTVACKVWKQRKWEKNTELEGETKGIIFQHAKSRF